MGPSSSAAPGRAPVAPGGWALRGAGQRARAALLIAASLTFAAAPLLGCGSEEKANRPVSPLTFDPAAKTSYQGVRRAWERHSVTTRADAADAIAAHLRAFPRDPTAGPARAMMALLELDAGDLAEAWNLAERARTAGPGVVRDDADVVRGAVLLRRDDAAAAIAILRPLDGKIIDAHFRDAFDGELADAAVRTGDAPRALAAMRRWLGRTSAAERDAVKERIASLIALMDEATLRDALSGPLPEDDEDVVVARVAAGLARIARERRDALLARFLLDRVPDRLGEDADPLAAIAARAGGAVVAPKTIGLLVSSRSTELARRGLEVAAGLSFALHAERVPSGTAEGPGAAAEPTLLVRDAQLDRAAVPDAVARLASDGAGIVIAGFDREDADAVATYAEESRLPVLLLTPPSKPPRPDSRVFVLGEEPRRVRRVLLDALAAAGLRRVAVLASDPPSVGVDEGPDGTAIVAVQPCGASLDFARGAAADALLVDGGPDCARAAVEMLEAQRRDWRVAFSLDAATEPAAHDLLAAAGVLPGRGASAGGDAELQAWSARGRAAPSWWAALGHDAGRLALGALDRAGASAEARDVRAVEARRAQLASALELVEAPLWTTGARGFARGRALSRGIEAQIVARPVVSRPKAR